MGLVRMRSHLRRAFAAEDGAVLVITAFIFIALLGIAALVIDIVNIHQAKLRAQATADAAVLAAAFDINDLDSAVAAGKEYAWRNYHVTDGDWDGCNDPDALAVATSVPCISVDDADDPSLIRIRVPDRDVPSFFASVLGRDGFNVSAAAIAEVELVTVSSGGSSSSGDEDASVRDGFSGGWTSTATGEGCPGGFWEDYPPAEDDPGEGKKKKKGSGGEWREYIFVFEHLNGDIVVWCDTNRNDKYVGQTDIYGNTIGKCCKETLLPGGTDTEEPYSMALAHVSCSGNWDSGWSTKDHPDAVNDPEWRVVFYRLDRRSGDGEVLEEDYEPCEQNFFGAVTAEEPVIEPIIRLYG